MSDARQAIQAARDAEAARYAPEALRNAERLMDSAEQNLGFGTYERARQAALAARAKAIKARDAAMVSDISVE